MNRRADTTSGRPNRPRRLRRAAIRLTSFFTVVIVLGWALDISGWLESRLMYYPSREPFLTPGGVEDVWFENADGQRLHAWFIPAPGASPEAPAPAILHVHGNAGNISSHAEFSRFLPEHGFSVLVFDYRSYGRSDRARGGLNRHKLLEDSRAALDALLARPDVDPERVGLLGVSLGGVIGLALVESRDDVGAIVSVAAFSSWRAIASHHLGLLGRVLARRGLDADRNAAQLGDRPLLVLHGQDDEIVPVSHADAIHEAALNAGVGSTLVIAQSTGHNDILIIGQDEQDAVAAFLKSVFVLREPKGALRPPDSSPSDR